MDPSKILDRFLDRPRVAEARRVLDVYGQAPGGLLANGLAFAALFGAFPIALVTLGVAGWLVDDPSVQAQLARTIGAVLPPLRDLVDQALLTLSDGAAITSVVGLVGLIWTVSQFYVTLDVAFARIFAGRQERNVFRRAARGFVSVAGLAGIVVALIVGGSLAAAAEAFLPASSAALIALGRVLSSIPFVVSVGVLAVATVYRFVPPRSPTWSAVGIPAVVAGVAIVLLSQLFAYVAPRLIGAALLTGSLATAFVALAWLSFTFQVLLLGAAWVRVRDDAEDTAAAEHSALAGAAAPAEPGGRGE
ncbi:MAG TPA: YihY/virulence factor BrkB family protein [Methylomirabilota bacterium]|nr:YihY/virulence factor BrkB family protein [Methylomirabilota bacterium]